MKMTEDDRILLRQIAKKARQEIYDRWEAAGVRGKDTSAAAGERDQIARAVFQKTKPYLQPKFTFPQLLYFVGILEGKIKERDQ
ncbi:hypothetical protein HWC07_gp054 [Pantoea phage vB_PagM_LIET2]|uniref:Uncharacterized protein n=1 Tax=Pantoea phage vB_PagM_LIET2 TaxID=2508071 RepID=A0A411AW41_9CAUD|nr:hypothetical protein HWC07_gp054 [Pantoea phage vB_PagM_LIET2]QAX92306.1 hypothetical protein LIET2_gp054 [Pantoea phage vB_PagM_LIET2]UJH95952.1 hypothetical protein [Pantoea phage Nafs113]